MTHSLRHLILFTSVASSCLLAAGTPSMPAAEALKERARAALPKDWQITSFQEGIVPDGWASSDSSCVKLVAEQGNKKVTFWLLPLDWVGVRLKSANSRPPGKPVYVSSRDYRGIFHLADLSERLICRGMYAWPGRYHDSVYPPDTWPELNELINKLILEHCPTDAARDEAARSLLDLGIPAPALIRDRAENSRAKDRDRFIRYLPRYAGPKALPLLRRLMLDAEDKATRKAAERSHRSVLARIAYDEMGSPAGKKPWPQEAQISYEPERKVYLLGEPILVDFVVKNTGKRPFAFYEGQDSRCAARNLRFRFVATDEAGDRVRDPYPFTSSWGGVLLHNFLMPGESYRKTLDLRRWCAFVCPGVYRVTGGQILGWDSEEKIARRRQTRGPHPVGGRFNITIREPDRATMEALVEKKDAGDRPVSAIDCYFKLLHAPAYVPILKAMLKDEGQDRQRTLRGLAGIQTHEVTRLFIDQMKSDDWKIRIAAAREVFLRLPARVVHGEVRRAFHYRYYTDEEWAPFIARVWSERMREPIRRIVRKSLMELPQWKWKPALTEEELLDPARERTEISRQLRDDYLRIVHEIIQILGDVDDVECLKQAINVLARERRNAMDLVRLAVDLQLQGAAPLPLPGEKSTTADWLVWLELKGRDTKELRQKYSAQYEMAISNT
ncbi:MAG: HEAT repeat domain-containing protein, partial [Planctomycetota bacterium]|nr:HEAT repeat domain-containing protein [Planctomycetota bacterium]